MILVCVIIGRIATLANLYQESSLNAITALPDYRITYFLDRDIPHLSSAKDAKFTKDANVV